MGYRRRRRRGFSELSVSHLYTVGFLNTHPAPTRAELAHGISGNLCRCQDYDKILTAMMRGAENMRKVNRA